MDSGVERDHNDIYIRTVYIYTVRFEYKRKHLIAGHRKPSQHRRLGQV